MGANADLIRSAWEAFGRQDLDAATADMDASGEVIAPETLPWGGTHTGPDGFKEMIGRFMAQLEDFRPSPEGFFEADDDYVFVPLDVQARTETGNDLSGRALWMYRLRDGKITRAELFVDTANTLKAIG